MSKFYTCALALACLFSAGTLTGCDGSDDTTMAAPASDAIHLTARTLSGFTVDDPYVLDLGAGDRAVFDQSEGPIDLSTVLIVGPGFGELPMDVWHKRVLASEGVDLLDEPIFVIEAEADPGATGVEKDWPEVEFGVDEDGHFYIKITF